VGDPKRSFLQIVEGIERGEVKALMLAECDPFNHFTDRKRLERAVDRLELLVVMDYLNSEAVDRADVFLPTATLYEAGGHYINQEGRLQITAKAYKGGLPIVQSGGGDHPPRIYGAGIPAAEARPAWQMLAELADKNTGTAKERDWLADITPEIGGLPSSDDMPADGVRLQSAADTDLRFKGQHVFGIDKAGDPDSSLELILVDWTFGTEELSAYAACLRELEPEPCATMHTRDARVFNLNDGDRIEIETDSGKLELILRVADNMATGVLVIPRHRKLSWQMMGAGRIRIGKDRIRKAGSD
jgi:NADH-quinone oxidoreductase subunit G